MMIKKEDKFLTKLNLSGLTFDKKITKHNNSIYYSFNDSDVSEGNYVSLTHDSYDNNIFIVNIVKKFKSIRTFVCFKEELESKINCALRNIELDNTISKKLDWYSNKLEEYKIKCEYYINENAKLRNDLEQVNNGLTFRIQKYCDFGYADFSDPTTNYRKYMTDEYFKHTVDDSKKKFVDSLIEQKLIKQSESEDYLEWHIKALPIKD